MLMADPGVRDIAIDFLVDDIRPQTQDDIPMTSDRQPLDTKDKLLAYERTPGVPRHTSAPTVAPLLAYDVAAHGARDAGCDVPDLVGPNVGNLNQRGAVRRHPDESTGRSYDLWVAVARGVGSTRIYMRLQDPEFTRILIVTLAQTTPVQEATDLQTDLRRAGIEPYGWIVNASLASSNTHDPVLRRRATLEHDQVRHVRDKFAQRAWIVPWRPDPPSAHIADGRPERW